MLRTSYKVLKVLKNALVVLEGVGSVFSRLLNVIFFLGSPDQTLSARAYTEGVLNPASNRWVVTYKIINRIFFWQRDHCRSAWQADVESAMETLGLNRARTWSDPKALFD